jgi:hypothetical protein
MEEMAQTIHDAMVALGRRHQLVYDPRLLDGYDGFMGPLDHRKYLREILSSKIFDTHHDLVVETQVSCPGQPAYNAPKRKRTKKVTPFVDLMIARRRINPYTRRTTLDKFAVMVAYAAPVEGEGLQIARHGRCGTLPASRGDDMAYTVLGHLGNLERWVEEGSYAGGFLLVYSIYDGWKEGVDPYFPHEGQVLHGTLPRPKSLHRKSSPAVELAGHYPVEWSTWAEVPQTAAPGERTKRGDTVDTEGGLTAKYLLIPVAKREDDAEG